MKRAVFYGVSTGPGDPELITIKAVRTIEKCSVIAVPRTPGGGTLALDIVKSITDIKDKKIIYADFAMTRDAALNRKSHDTVIEDIEKYLDEGISVAMLSIGDISLYSTFGYIYDRLKNKYACEIVPGVNSFSACAARAGESLTKTDRPLTIIPGCHDNAERYLSAEGNLVIMKSGKGIYDIVKCLDEKGRDYTVVQNCGLENEVVSVRGDKEITDSYFTTILIRE